MSLKSLARRVDARLAAMPPERFAETVDIVVNIVLWYRYAWRRLDGELLTDLGLGAMEFMVKAKAGWKPEPMVATVRRESPRLEVVIVRVQEGIAHADDGMELRSETAEVREQGGGAGAGSAPAAGDGDVAPAASEPTLAPGR